MPPRTLHTCDECQSPARTACCRPDIFHTGTKFYENEYERPIMVKPSVVREGNLLGVKRMRQGLSQDLICHTSPCCTGNQSSQSQACQVICRCVCAAWKNPGAPPVIKSAECQAHKPALHDVRDDTDFLKPGRGASTPLRM